MNTFILPITTIRELTQWIAWVAEQERQAKKTNNQ